MSKQVAKEISNELKPLLTQQSKHFSYIVEDLNNTKDKLDNHINIYAKNGKEMARLATVVENSIEKMKEVAEAISDLKTESDINKKWRNILIGAWAVISIVFPVLATLYSMNLDNRMKYIAVEEMMHLLEANEIIEYVD